MPATVPATLAERLRELVQRELAALKEHSPDRASISRLAEEIGISHTYLSMLMRGIHDNPSMEVLQAIARRLHTTVEYLWSGNRAVNLWQELMASPEFPEVSKPSRTRGDRFAWVVNYAASVYSGHLSVTDIAAEMGIDQESLVAVLQRQWEPTDYQLEVLSDLTGVPVRWLRFGEIAILQVPGLEHVDAVRLSQYIDVLALAVQKGISPQKLRGVVEILADKE